MHTRRSGRHQHQQPPAYARRSRVARQLARFDRLVAGSMSPVGVAARGVAAHVESSEPTIAAQPGAPIKTFTDRVLATPDGPVIFEDPVLQAAWDIATTRDFRGAAAEGATLDDHALHWIPLILPLVRGKFARTRDVLLPRTPTRDVVLSSPLRLAIFGDAGYRGLAQRTVLAMIEARHRIRPFDAVIHLGDTYHGGSEAEMFRHLVVPLQQCQHRLAETRRPAMFSLCGNHDLYAGPDGYLGVLAAFDQPGRYFAIEAGPYRVACLDTAVADSGLRLDGKLDDEQRAWLARKQRDGKRLIVLTHHVPRSAWQAASRELGDQLADLPGLIAWYWGHEHRAVAFERDGFYGGCVGHGAFLEERSACRDPRGVAWYPRRATCTCFATQGSRYWPHGFLELELSDAGIEEAWRTEGGDDFTRRLPCA